MRLSTFLAPLALALAIAGGASAETLKMGLITPPSHQWTKSAATLADALSGETGGRLTLEVFPAGQLGNEAQMLQQLQSGALDLAFLTVGELTNRDPEFGVLTAPYLVETGEEAARLLEGEVAAGLLDRLTPLGLHGLGYGQAGMRIVLLSKSGPLEEGGTVAGRKIRTVPLAQELDFWRLAGTTPTPLPLTELYDAYANGQIDGMQIDYEGAVNMGFADLSSAVLATEHMIFPMVAVASARKWQGFSEEDRALIERLVGEEAARIRALYPEIDAGYRAQLEAAGVPVLTPGPEVFGPAVEEWNALWGQKTPVLEQLRAEADAL
ncbi:TRAP transporter substrate-binding protein [Celeribacter indicus]|uniref:TRAP transporter-DctP subunit n=1 Tax=Celeribacter indicus TaxID=1208324 RepID=A0A0B5E304_9RHOB|nr:TRAP transporter substrate-binding protein [Celeribacter indicus]AJE46827.1 TRAP transporter-DctP subunit [Celeribacter indicus]SDW80929.1 TRAP-type C4-dicarboxylate transport system, substrate-binding protein [Celeribacter indicus]